MLKFFRKTLPNVQRKVYAVQLLCERNLSIEAEYQKEIDNILKSYTFRSERKQALVGKVVSTKCLKSINVLVSHMKYVPKYDKLVRRHRKIMAHDENSTGEMGDLVRIVPSRPMSAKKRHILRDIIRKAPKLDLSRPSTGIE